MHQTIGGFSKEIDSVRVQKFGSLIFSAAKWCIDLLAGHEDRPAQPQESISHHSRGTERSSYGNPSR